MLWKPRRRSPERRATRGGDRKGSLLKHVHFIGIGGVGMSGLAQVLLARGVRVSGSDPHSNAATERLAGQGATIYSAQVAANIAREKPDLVVVTAAIHEGNPELAAAKAAGIS